MISGLTVQNLGIARGDRLLFEGLDLEVRAGEAVVLTGANGAGKTSLLRAIAGLLRPAAGKVVFGGPDGALDADEARRAGPAVETAPRGRSRATKPAGAGSPIQPDPVIRNQILARPQPTKVGFVADRPRRRGFSRRPIRPPAGRRQPNTSSQSNSRNARSAGPT